MNKRIDISLVASLFLLGACSLDPKNIGTPEETDASDSGDKDTTGTAGDTLEATGSTTDAQATTTDGQATDTDGQATDTDAQATDTDTGVPVVGCECAEMEPCSVQLCPSVEWVADNEGQLKPDAADALEVALTCALTALRDGTAGRIHWGSDIGGGYSDEHGRFELFGDGTGRRSYYGTVDVCTYEETVSFGPMKDAQFFSDCLAEPDPEVRFLCVREAGGGGSSVCGEPGEENCDGV